MLKTTKNQKLPKFKLNQETVRRLGSQELTRIVGGASGSGGLPIPHTGTMQVACCPH